jgi:hypothetical protein
MCSHTSHFSANNSAAPPTGIREQTCKVRLQHTCLAMQANNPTPRQLRGAALGAEWVRSGTMGPSIALDWLNSWSLWSRLECVVCHSNNFMQRSNTRHFPPAQLSSLTCTTACESRNCFLTRTSLRSPIFARLANSKPTPTLLVILF